ncbi:MAG: ABC transporter permease [Acidobacteria bacterium]|nr:ABC transporter permease [Acidobacteriota bacterium]
MTVPVLSGDPWLRRVLRLRVVRVVARGLSVALSVATVAFLIVRLAPGDPVRAILGDQATPASLEALRTQLGLDGNLLSQYVKFIGDILRWDLGRSLTSGTPVTTIIGASILPTISLVALTTLVAFLLSIPVGVRLAIKPDGVFGRFFQVFSALFLSAPGFFLGLLALLLFAMRLGLAPVAGFRAGFPEALRYLWLPALVICAQLVPILARVLRTSVARTLEEEFVEVAIVRGVGPLSFYWNHLIRPSIAPTIALLGYIMGQLLGASVMIEMVFDIPGIGTQLVRAVTTRDYPTVQGVILTFGFLVVIITTLSEMVTSYLDPRTGDQ